MLSTHKSARTDHPRAEDLPIRILHPDNRIALVFWFDNTFLLFYCIVSLYVVIIVLLMLLCLCWSYHCIVDVFVLCLALPLCCALLCVSYAVVGALMSLLCSSICLLWCSSVFSWICFIFLYKNIFSHSFIFYFSGWKSHWNLIILLTMKTAYNFGILFYISFERFA